MPSTTPFSHPSPAPTNALFPALYLYPLNDTWAPKHIALTSGPSAHTKIGRQTSSKTAPGERNGFFDSKVLSRQHAEVWEEGGKIYIRDVKSSNGTFINGERLSSEGHESEPFELKSDDIVEFGIDIVGEDNKTIIHHKVAARVVCVFTEQDVQVAARAEQHQQQQHQQQQQFMQQQHQMAQGGGQGGHQGQGQGGQHPGGLGGAGGQTQVIGGLNGLGSMGTLSSLAGPSSPSNPQPGQQTQNFPFAPRRPQQLAQGLGSMGAMGLRAPGKTGLSFDVILSRLQGEVQKSRETGAELGGVVGVMGEIGDVLGGAVPANLAPFPTHLPPVRAPTDPAPAAPTSGSPTAPILVPGSVAQPVASGSTSGPPPSATSPPPPSASATSDATPASSSESANSSASSASASDPASTSTSASSAPLSLPASTLLDIQTQLHETQRSLAAHLDKVRQLEGVLKEQEAMRREVGVLRGLLMERGAMGVGRNQEQDRERTHQEEREGEEREEGEEGEEEEESDDDDDDARSVGTVLQHELESVKEEDEGEGRDEFRAAIGAGAGAEAEAEGDSEGHPEAEGQVEREADAHEHEPTTQKTAEEPETEASDESDEDAEARERREDLGVGRPTTPEPGLLGMDREGRRKSAGSPLARVHIGRSTEEVEGVGSDEEREADHHVDAADNDHRAHAQKENGPDNATDNDVYEHISKLTHQLSSVLALAAALEKQHARAQDTIGALESKVGVLEGLVRDASASSAAAATTTSSEPTKEADGEEAEREATLAEKMRLWKQTVEGQWSAVQEEWADERVRLGRAREEWEGRVRVLEGIAAAVGVGAGNTNSNPNANSDVEGPSVKHRGGLVTPPSPRSQSSSSDSGSGRYRRRKKRAAAGVVGAGGGVGGKESGAESSASEGEEESGKEEEKGAVRTVPQGEKEKDAARSLATPEGSVYTLSDSITSLDGSGSGSPSASVKNRKDRKEKEHPLTATASLDQGPDLDDDSISGSHECEGGEEEGREEERALHKHTMDGRINGNSNGINVQTAFGVVILSVAAAAVFWKIKPE